MITDEEMANYWMENAAQPKDEKIVTSLLTKVEHLYMLLKHHELYGLECRRRAIDERLNIDIALSVQKKALHQNEWRTTTSNG